MRILQVLRAPVGGLFRHVCDLTQALSERGHSVGVVVDTLTNDAQTEQKLQALQPYASLGIHRYPMPRVLGAGDLKTPFVISALAKKLEIEILHGHGAKGGFYARLAKLTGAKAQAFYTPHGGVLHFSSASPSGRIFHGLERQLMRQTKSIIFESGFAQRTYSALIGAPTCPSTIIHNGLAEREFTPVSPAANAADFCFVGELRDLKGIFVLVEALAGVKRKDGTQATLVMAGDGPARSTLEERIGQLGLSAHVRLIGSKPARDVFALGRCAVLPSLAESLPYVVLEASAAGVPVITTNVGGIPEIYATTHTSLIAPNDVHKLGIAMQDFINATARFDEENRVRKELIQNNFTIQRMTDQIEALYRNN